MKSYEITLIFALISCAICAGQEVTKSRKKGLVIPSWPQQKPGDFDAFSTVSWWYNYHTYKEVWDQVPWWCHYEDGSIPNNKTLCLPSDPDVHFVPQIFGVEGYGARPDQHLEPEIADWEWIYLAYNEPNQPDQSDIPPKIAAQNYKELTEQYPDKVVVSPATGHVDTEWFDEFWEECLILECRIDYIATHQYKGTIDERMKELKDYSLRYGKQIWLTEFALALEEDTQKIVEFVEEFLPRLEEAGFIFRYSWFYTRYYIDHDHTDPWFWLDSNNSLMEQDRPELSLVGQAYDKPWHLESFREEFRASKKGL